MREELEKLNAAALEAGTAAELREAAEANRKAGYVHLAQQLESCASNLKPATHGEST